MGPSINPFAHIVRELDVDGQVYRYFDIEQLNRKVFHNLPFSIRILLESAVRCCDEFQITSDHVQRILDWENQQHNSIEIPFKPSRVILQDFTGVPALIDFAVMRDAYKSMGGDPLQINPLCPTDLVIDHSVQVDFSRTVINTMRRNHDVTKNDLDQVKLNHNEAKLCGDCEPSGRCLLNEQLNSTHKEDRNSVRKGPVTIRGQNSRKIIVNAKSVSERANEPIDDLENWVPHNLPKLKHETCPFHQIRSVGAESLQRNQDLEFDRNRERFEFLKWSARSLKNMLIVPPGSGIVHQVNLEYLARVVFEDKRLLYPDSLVGADSHTTMINGLGIVGWGVGGIEAEAVMLGQAISMVLPQVIGYRLVGNLPDFATSTDVVLTITKHLRTLGVVGKFVEFFGPGVTELSIADRATIANMCPEYGATVGFFPCDEKSIQYLQQTGREAHKIDYIEKYLRLAKLFRNYDDPDEEPKFTSIAELDLSTVTPSASGPKRPQDRIAISEMKADFAACLRNKISFKGFGIKPEQLNTEIKFVFDGKPYSLRHGSVVISAITSCTNTSNPSVMLGAGLLAKKAVEAGLDVAPYIKTSISPGSGVVTYYLNESGVTPYLEKLGFDIVGYGCMTCIGNSGPLPDEVVEAIEKGDLVAVGILSGNRNFEGRVHPNTRANYLASPLLVVAYAVAGTVDIDFVNEPIGIGHNSNLVYLKDIWPSREEIQEVEQKFVIPAMFKEVYSKIQNGNQKWNRLDSKKGLFYKWNQESTYIKRPPFFDRMSSQPDSMQSIEHARALLVLGDSVTTDHISPAGSISKSSEAAAYLMSKGVLPRDFNSYGSRRGNDAVMVRGTFANFRIVNKLLNRVGPKTIHFPTNEEVSIYEAAVRYKRENTPLIVLAGKDYGCGSSRDWAAKGPFLLGVRAVIAESFERIHRSNLIGMGIVPLQLESEQSVQSLGLSGREIFDIPLSDELRPRDKVIVTTDDGKQFSTICRFDTDIELTYFKHGGILCYMLRQMLPKNFINSHNNHNNHINSFA